MAREKHQDKNSNNKKPATSTAGGKTMKDSPEGLKNKGKSGKGRVNPMSED